jgi:hypothetical protein
VVLSTAMGNYGDWRDQAATAGTERSAASRAQTFAATLLSEGFATTSRGRACLRASAFAVSA